MNKSHILDFNAFYKTTQLFCNWGCMLLIEYVHCSNFTIVKEG